MDIIKVSGTSRTSAVAGAIAGVFRENKRAEVQAIGAGAVNQAVKALVLAKGYLAEDGYEVVFTPEFTDVEIGDKVRTAIRLTVTERDAQDETWEAPQEEHSEPPPPEAPPVESEALESESVDLKPSETEPSELGEMENSL